MAASEYHLNVLTSLIASGMLNLGKSFNPKFVKSKIVAIYVLPFNACARSKLTKHVLPLDSLRHARHTASTSTFLFSFRNRDDLDPFKSSVAADRASWVIYQNALLGPTFREHENELYTAISIKVFFPKA